jgi:putative FmdB family regulatory protein
VPTYDYVCADCGYEMEVMHSVHGHGPGGCPRCGGAMKKAISAPAVHFKGSGWARKERSSAGIQSRPGSRDAGSGSGEGSGSSAGDGGAPSKSEPAAKDAD